MRAARQSVSDLFQRAFWLLPAVMVIAGIGAGILLPLLDEGVGGTFVERPESARAILAAIATVTVSVAGVTFSIIVVALILGSSQLSPRVMRTFRAQKLNQVVLGMFVGTFAYSLLVLRSVGTRDDAAYVPHISVVVAVVLAIVAFGLFIAFIGRIVNALEASAVIRRITAEGVTAINSPFPGDCADAPDDPSAASSRVEQRMAGPASEVRAQNMGFLRSVQGAAIVEAAREHRALVVQDMRVGDFVVTGDLLARAWCEPADRDPLGARVHDAFRLGVERTPLHDIGFSIRQLADVALRGVSPAINDPTTAETAMNALGDTLVRIARRQRPERIRVDADAVERFVTSTPDLEGLVKLGFDQVRIKSGTYPVLCVRLLELLHKVDAAADGGCAECARQAHLIARTVASAGVIDEDVERVDEACERLFGGVSPR